MIAVALVRVRHMTLTAAHQPQHRRPVLVVVRGRAMTVRPGVAGVDLAEDVAGGAVVVVDGFGAVEGDDVGGGRCGGVGEDQHVGESLPGFARGCGPSRPRPAGACLGC